MKIERVPAMIGRERMWKLGSWGAGALGALIAKTLIRAIYRTIRKEDPAVVFDPASSRFSWPDAAMWAVASGLGLAVGKMVSTRVAAIGWEAATGTPPPRAEERAVA